MTTTQIDRSRCTDTGAGLTHLKSSSMQTDFVLDALKQALYARQPEQNELAHHSDCGAHYVSIKYNERLAAAGIEPSVGSKGDKLR
jgi:putative transposase